MTGKFVAILRGLFLGLSLSLLNFVGLFLTITLIGGFGDWAGTQFVGIFGAFEIATGIAFILCPNIWRLPVVEAETEERINIKLAVSSVFIPHWAGGAKCIAGAAMVAVAIYYEGASFGSLALVPFVILVGVGTTAASIALARWGVHRPDFDVLHIAIRRPGRDELALPGISITASALQILLGTFTLPVLVLVPPEAFFASSFAPTVTVLLITVVGTVVATALALVAWRGRLAWEAPLEQQEKLEQPA